MSAFGGKEDIAQSAVMPVNDPKRTSQTGQRAIDLRQCVQGSLA